MAYWVNFFMEILSGILSSLIVIFLWIAIYRSAGREVISGYTLKEIEAQEKELIDKAFVRS